MQYSSITTTCGLPSLCPVLKSHCAVKLNLDQLLSVVPASSNSECLFMFIWTLIIKLQPQCVYAPKLVLWHEAESFKTNITFFNCSAKSNTTGKTIWAQTQSYLLDPFLTYKIQARTKLFNSVIFFLWAQIQSSSCFQISFRDFIEFTFRSIQYATFSYDVIVRQFATQIDKDNVHLGLLQPPWYNLTYCDFQINTGSLLCFLCVRTWTCTKVWFQV